MVKTNEKSKFVLLSLEQIRDTQDVILQMLDTGTQFTDGRKCFLCEVVNSADYKLRPCYEDLLRENLRMINEVLKLRDKIERLQNKIRRLEK